MTTRRLIAAATWLLLVSCGSPLYLDRGDGGLGGAGGGGLGGARLGSGGAMLGGGGAPMGSGGAPMGSGGTPMGSGGTSIGTGGAVGVGGMNGAGGMPGTGGKVIGVGGTIGTGGVSGTGGRGTGGQINTQSDGKNCGVVGHDCLGGMCVGGQCQPVMLGRYTRDFLTMSVGATYVYGKDDSTRIVRAKKDGTDLSASAVPAFATSACQQSRSDEDGARVFYLWYDGTSSGCRMAYCSTSDCDGTTTPISGPGTYTFPFGVDHSNHRVFWEDQIAKRFVASPSTGTIAGVTITSSDISNLPQDDRVLYAGGGLIYPDGPSILRLPASGGALNAVGSAPVYRNAFASNGVSVFWADATSISYSALPDAAGGATKLLDVANVRSLAVDTAHIYWSTAGASYTLETCDLASCAATRRPLPIVGCPIEDIGMDDVAVYWISDNICPIAGTSQTDRSQIWKVAK